MSGSYTIDYAGRTFTLETGRFARQAGGAVMVRYGDTAVLVTATASATPRVGIDFFPLTVDFEERTYAVGRIPGGIFRREGRPTERAILTGRVTDRAIRPLFPEGFRNDVQVISTVMSLDHDNAPELCSLIGASVALQISDIPFDGPVGAAIVGLVDGEFVLNPTTEQAARSDLHLVVAGTRDAVLMVEAGALQVSEERILEAIMFGHREMQPVIQLQEAMGREIGRPKREIPLFEVGADLKAAAGERAPARLRNAIQNSDKTEREAKTKETLDLLRAELAAEFPDRTPEITAVLQSVLKAEVRHLVVRKKLRADGRALDEIRPISVDVAVLARAHGTGLFVRGQTQVLTALTLGTVSDVQKLIDLGLEETKRLMHHYNFPPSSVGETRPLRGPGRREIGHGALAERALEPVIPKDTTDFPYTIRLVSEVLESNGSSSMASVCASCLALMDGGVPILAPVAGIAMGLLQDGDEMAVLTDIQGVEDHLGDMDFKIAGTATGITAVQMDIKIKGVTRAILAQALEQARVGRLFILDKMLAVLPAPRPELSKYAPRIIVLQINPERIRDVIGPGGKMINKIIAECNVEIDIEDDGKVYIAAIDPEGCKKAMRIIEGLTKDVEMGSVYDGKVTRLTDFGAFVEILPGKEGLVRIGDLSDRRVERVEDAVSVGDVLSVKVIEIDRLGRVNLSHRALVDPTWTADEGSRDRGDRGGRPSDGRGGGGRPGFGGNRDRGPRR
jgi:polyribonucleotide nucleotidyltransferase